MNKQHIIKCSGISVGYNSEDILHNLDLKIKNGVLLPFIGPNGAGKTTILKAILGLIPIKGGLLECDFGTLPPAYVPQQKHIDPLYPVSLRKIVEMGLYPELGFWKRPNKKHIERIEHSLEWFKLINHQKKRFSELSGGMRQKALLARAFVSGSELIILDEPTAGLDADSERDVLQYLIELNEKQKKTILLAHHRLEDLSHLSENICLIDQKKAKYISSKVVWQQFHRHLHDDKKEQSDE